MISVPTALALAALLLAGFAVLAIGGVYARLRHLERVLADTTLAAAQTSAPAQLQPDAGVAATVALVLDGECPVCHQLADAVADAAAGDALPGLRVVRLFASEQARAKHADADSVETLVDPDAWSEVHEGYTPTVSVIDRSGRVAHRTFVYADTDLQNMIKEIAARFGARQASSAG